MILGLFVLLIFFPSAEGSYWFKFYHGSGCESDNFQEEIKQEVNGFARTSSYCFYYQHAWYDADKAEYSNFDTDWRRSDWKEGDTLYLMDEDCGEVLNEYSAQLGDCIEVLDNSMKVEDRWDFVNSVNLIVILVAVAMMFSVLCFCCGLTLIVVWGCCICTATP